MKTVGNAHQGLLPLADALLTAERERHTIRPISARYPGLTAADAYRIQQEIVRQRVEVGEEIVGWKIGLTSKPMQEQLGVDQPDYAPILSGTLVASGEPVSIDRLIQPRVEAEIAFVLGRALAGPGVSPQEVLDATRGVMAAIEVIDSRIEGWKISFVDTVADMASSARVVTSGRIVPLEGLDLRLLGVVFERNDELVATAAGAAALGDPATAVAWAANTLGALGVTLESGDIVMPGALHASVAATRGDAFRATFHRLGAVEVRFE